MNIKSVTSQVLDEPPSAVAFCPSHPDYYVVSTYLLHPHAEGEATSAPQKRTGTLILYRLQGTEPEQIQSLPLDSAVLDIEWCPHAPSDSQVLCIATSTGSLLFYTLTSTPSGSLSFNPTPSKAQIADEETLVLDLVWHPTNPSTIAATLSSGEVVLCRSSTSWTPTAPSSDVSIEVQTVTTHSLEPWTLAFSPSTSRLFSGGDDAVLQITELPMDEDAVSSPGWSDRRTHQAGITAILPLSETLLLTGSYDDHIRLLRVPGPGERGRAQVLSEENLDGGVWRLRMLREQRGEDGEVEACTVLASCMHAGSRVVRLMREGEEWGFEVMGKFEEHESMNYGSDVKPLANGEAEGRRTVVSTSFYDRLMCVWEVKVEK